MKEFFRCEYGSKLYGTNTPASDTDIKVVYLPELTDLLVGKKLSIFKKRVDKNGNELPDHSPMPAGGVETEYIPIQRFALDFVNGQTYALEIAHATWPREARNDIAVSFFLFSLIRNFGNADVYSMVSFAKKQTMDYVHRAERLNETRKLMAIISPLPGDLRLDENWGEELVLDYVARQGGVKIGTVVNNHKALRTLELNGRSYLETSKVDHVKTAISKLIDSYGERTNAASEQEIDYKSLSHAIRVYEQSIELLDTGYITFPRSNAELLLKVKQGQCDLELVKVQLQKLDEEVKEKMLTTKLSRLTPELKEKAETWLAQNLLDLYSLGLKD